MYLLSLSLLGCSSPVEAPKDFNELLSYLFVHSMDEVDEELIAGAENLVLFSNENLELLQEGYTVSNLSSEALESTGDTFPESEDTVGVTLQYSINYPVESIAYSNTVVSGMEVYPENYLSYERESLSDLDCFLNRTCNSFQYRSTILTSLPLGAEILSSYINELRWITLESGLAFVQRTWMEGEAESSVDWADMTANFYVALNFSSPNGSEVIAASWAAAQLGEIPLPEDVLKNQALDGLRSNGDDLNKWLSDNNVPEPQ